jgi:Zn-dependent M28 family amino/carboxypeptidase
VLAAAPFASAAPPTDTEVLRGAVTTAGILEHENTFQTIATANGGTRASGTPGYDASLAYVKEQLDDTGYFTTRVQEFDFDFFQETAPAEFQRVSPNPLTYTLVDHFLTMEYSGSGDVTGALVPTNDIVLPPGPTASSSNSGCEPADFKPASTTEDQVALIQRGTCDFVVKAHNAAAAGYDAVIIFNEGQEGRQETLNGTLGGVDPTLATIPVIGTSFAVGNDLYSRLQSGEVVVRVATTTVTETRHTANLIADTNTGRTDRVVVVGSHLDSVPEGPGINDNGSGSSSDLEVALRMAELGIEPRNQVRFAFWGAEESGLIGSQFYVDSLSARELKNIAVNLNFDMVGSPNFVRFVYDGDGSAFGVGDTGSGVVESVFNDYFASQSLPTEPNGVRRPLGLRRLPVGRHPRRRPVHRRRGHQDSCPGGHLRRHRRHCVRPLLPPGLRHDQQPVEHGTGPDVGRHSARHAHVRPDDLRGPRHGQGQGQGPRPVPGLQPAPLATGHPRTERHGGRPWAALRRVDAVLRLLLGQRGRLRPARAGVETPVVDRMDRLRGAHTAGLVTGIGDDHDGDAERQDGDRRDGEQRSHEVVLGAEHEAGVLSRNVLLQNFHIHWAPP